MTQQPSESPFASLSLEHSSTVDRVAEELHRALFDGDIEPGTPLREIALADAMGVSRSTIREALGVLVAEGLATRAPNRGVFVTELDPEAVRDVGRARAVVEVAGVRRWAEASEGARDGVRRALADFQAAATSQATPSELTWSAALRRIRSTLASPSRTCSRCSSATTPRPPPVSSTSTSTTPRSPCSTPCTCRTRAVADHRDLRAADVTWPTFTGVPARQG